jgi:hypothetical protein
MGMRTLGVLLFLTMALAACTLGPRFVNHPQPALAVDHGPFASAGCPVDDTGWPRCLPDSPLAVLGCDAMRPAPDLLGGLDPPYPIAVCEVYPHWHQEDPTRSEEALQATGSFVLRRGGLWPIYVRYVVYRDDTFGAVQNVAALRELYAPIESSEEALSYALAVSGLEAHYGLARQPGYAYEALTIEDSHVAAVGDGYRLLLYDTQVFGCGPHWTYAVELHLRSDGELSELSRERAFRDRSTDDMCID